MNPSMKPVHEFRFGVVRAAIWKNSGANQRAYFNVSLSRLYRVGEQWKETSSFGRDQLPLVAKAADMAFEWIWNQHLAEKSSSGS